MTFVKYQHVEHINSDVVEGLTEGKCYIFPKMDGMNASVYVEDGRMRCASRNLPLDENHPFSKYCAQHEGIVKLFQDHPELRIYGEWMIPHTVRTYLPEVWNNWYVFDVCVAEMRFDDELHGQHDEGHYYVPYPKYKEMLDHYGIRYLAPLDVIDNPSMETIADIVNNRNTVYIEPGSGCGEGVVVKNYDYKNRFGGTIWGKRINSAFVIKKAKRSIPDPDSRTLEEVIAKRAVTPELVLKEYHKIAEEGTPVHPAKLLSIVWYCFITECLWDELKKSKNPVIDFKLLRHSVDEITKDTVPKLYGRYEDEVAT